MPSQHVVIMGGSSGIGLATAKLLLDQDCRVTITGRNEQTLAAAKASLKSDVATLVVDGANEARVGESFARIGSFDHVVLAFGSGKGAGPFASVSLADVRQGFEEKVFPHFACAQAALPHLRKDGSITFIAAVSAQAALPGTAGLGAANAAVAAMAQGAAAALLCGWRPGFAMIAGSVLIVQASRAWFYRRIGGVNGDCLGFTEQLIEIFVLTMFACRSCAWS